MVGLEGNPLLWASSRNQSINSNKYSSELDWLKAALDKKCPELVKRKCIIFHQENTRLRISLMTRQKLLTAGWQVLIHPSYSPDIASLDFHFFWSLQNSFNGKNFNSLVDYKRHLEQFFAQKDKKFLEDGIMMLPEKMAEGSGTKWRIHCSLKFLVKIRNVSFIFT